MEIPSALQAASARYAVAWKDFASAADTAAGQKKQIGRVLSKGIPTGSTKYDDAVRAVGELQGTKDVLASAQRALASELRGFDSADAQVPDEGRHAFDAAVRGLTEDVQRPPNMVRWNTQKYASVTDSFDKTNYGFRSAGLGIVGGLGGLIGGAIAGASDGGLLATTAAGAGAVGSMPYVRRHKVAGEAFEYVDGMATATSKAARDGGHGRKIDLANYGVTNGSKVGVSRFVRGLDRLASDSQKRAAKAQTQDRNLADSLGNAKQQAEHVARVQELLESSRAGRVDEGKTTAQKLKDLEDFAA